MSAVLADDAPRARILECTEAEYFADPGPTPSLSQSMATTMLTRSPLHAWTRHPKLGNVSEKESTEDRKAKDDGTLIHKLLLGKGAEVAVLDVPDYRTNYAKELRDNAIASGALPVKKGEYAHAVAVATILNQQIHQLGHEYQYFFHPEALTEVAFEWFEDGADGPVRCKCRMDRVYFGADFGVIFDFKKIRSASIDQCERHLAEFGYDIQRAAYLSCAEKYRPDLAGRIKYRLLFGEIKDQPYCVTPAKLNGPARTFGESRWERAVLLWERCLREKHWPPYTERTVELEIKPWVLEAELGGDHAG